MSSLERRDCDVCRSSDAKFAAHLRDNPIYVCHACAEFLRAGFAASRQNIALVQVGRHTEVPGSGSRQESSSAPETRSRSGPATGA